MNRANAISATLKAIKALDEVTAKLNTASTCINEWADSSDASDRDIGDDIMRTIRETTTQLEKFEFMRHNMLVELEVLQEQHKNETGVVFDSNGRGK
jgi:hypothetical protein|tara:strand:- start:1020 stop:1310 length:291 start_codon:yes stop_codon:yes gene_type:complete